MIQDLKNNNLVILDDGALISSEKTEPPVLILKSDGTYLYMTTDLATVLNREERISPDNYLYIVDNQQSEHFKQLFSSVKYFNFSKSNFEHIGFGTINDAEGKPFKLGKETFILSVYGKISIKYLLKKTVKKMPVYLLIQF